MMGEGQVEVREKIGSPSWTHIELCVSPLIQHFARFSRRTRVSGMILAGYAPIPVTSPIPQAA
jgi:hypothetical protein